MNGINRVYNIISWNAIEFSALQNIHTVERIYWAETSQSRWQLFTRTTLLRQWVTVGWLYSAISTARVDVLRMQSDPLLLRDSRIARPPFPRFAHARMPRFRKCVYRDSKQFSCSRNLSRFIIPFKSKLK